MSRIIGWMNWDACEHCQYCPVDQGGCDVDGPENVSVECDYVECLSYKERSEEEEAIEVNPDQLSLEATS
jgi:hypothetical protein